MGVFWLLWLVPLALLLGTLMDPLGPWAGWWWGRVRRRVSRVWRWPWGWYLVGAPLMLCRVRWSWRQMADNLALSEVRRPAWTVIGSNSMVMGRSIRPVPPLLGVPRMTRTGVVVRVRMHPGQTPAQYVEAAEGIAHTWRAHSVRVLSPRPRMILLVATARDALAGEVRPVSGSGRLLTATVGLLEDGDEWLIDFRTVPHWLVVGATQSGKSTWLAALVSELAPQRVALIGIDLKGGLELGLFEARLTALATSRDEAVQLLGALLDELIYRMRQCRMAGVRNVWDLPEDERPVPIVVIVDEVAELYLHDGSREGREAFRQSSSALLRLAQLGRALGLHLVVAGQRVGSDLGPGVTALRAQLGGRVCHRVNDPQTAEMALGDLQPDAVVAAQSITETERGVAVQALSGRWTRARSALVTPEQAERTAERYGDVTPVIASLGSIGGGTERAS
ncbi:FtsK/SpoIIIE domain-containing protein [Streptomyces mayteni]